MALAEQGLYPNGSLAHVMSTNPTASPMAVTQASFVPDLEVIRYHQQRLADLASAMRSLDQAYQHLSQRQAGQQSQVESLQTICDHLTANLAAAGTHQASAQSELARVHSKATFVSEQVAALESRVSDCEAALDKCNAMQATLRESAAESTAAMAEHAEHMCAQRDRLSALGDDVHHLHEKLTTVTPAPSVADDISHLCARVEALEAHITAVMSPAPSCAVSLAGTAELDQSPPPVARPGEFVVSPVTQASPADPAGLSLPPTLPVSGGLTVGHSVLPTLPVSGRLNTSAGRPGTGQGHRAGLSAYNPPPFASRGRALSSVSPTPVHRQQGAANALPCPGPPSVAPIPAPRVNVALPVLTTAPPGVPPAAAATLDRVVDSLSSLVTVTSNLTNIVGQQAGDQRSGGQDKTRDAFVAAAVKAMITPDRNNASVKRIDKSNWNPRTAPKLLKELAVENENMSNPGVPMMVFLHSVMDRDLLGTLVAAADDPSDSVRRQMYRPFKVLDELHKRQQQLLSKDVKQLNTDQFLDQCSEIRLRLIETLREAASVFEPLLSSNSFVQLLVSECSMKGYPSNRDTYNSLEAARIQFTTTLKEMPRETKLYGTELYSAALNCLTAPLRKKVKDVVDQSGAPKLGSLVWKIASMMYERGVTVAANGDVSAADPWPETERDQLWKYETPAKPAKISASDQGGSSAKATRKELGDSKRVVFQTGASASSRSDWSPSPRRDSLQSVEGKLPHAPGPVSAPSLPARGEAHKFEQRQLNLGQDSRPSGHSGGSYSKGTPPPRRDMFGGHKSNKPPDRPYSGRATPPPGRVAAGIVAGDQDEYDQDHGDDDESQGPSEADLLAGGTASEDDA